MKRIVTSVAVFMLSAALAAAQSRPPAVPAVVPPRPAATPASRLVIPLATPVATATPAVVATPTPTPTPDVPLPPVNISIERISLLRNRFYNPEQAERPAVWTPRMLLEFQVAVPKGWTLMSVDDGELTTVTDSRGRPIPARLAIGPKGEVGKAGKAVMLEVKPDHAAFEFTTELPGRDDDRLDNVTAKFELTLGIARPVRIDNLRTRKPETSLLPKDKFPDLIVALAKIDEDSISVALFGDLSKVGGFTFSGPDGKKLDPITEERTDSEPQPGKAPGALYRYTFVQLPRQISMEVNYFALKRRAVYTYKNTQIPLP